MMIDFEIIINEPFAELDANNLAIVGNKNVLSIANDFESGKWRHRKFSNYIWDNIAETALSAKERKKLIGKNASTLSESAQKLRLTNNDKIGSGSELCEILLYGIMKDHYGALPVVPKIFYKQNSQDNAKGPDSVHVVVANGNFSLWFGEAKFYEDIDKAINDAIISINKFLRNDDQIKKENSIITSIPDIDELGLDKKIAEKIKSSLSGSNSLDNIKTKVNIPILLLHECELTKLAIKFSENYKASIIKSHTEKANRYFSLQLNKMSDIIKYSDITFNLILFPVPKKSEIVESFVSHIKHYRNQ